MDLRIKRAGCLVMALMSLVPLGHSRTGGTNAPPRVAFFYGYPSLVNGAKGDIGSAVRVFSAYDIIVLGDGVEFPTMVKRRHPVGVGRVEYERSQQIIASLLQRKPEIEIFGYVCLGDTQSLPESGLKRRIQMWKALGVTGIFLDEAGYDWSIVTRTRQNKTIRFIHSLGMPAFLNAYHPKTLTELEVRKHKNPSGEPSALTSRDLILLESFPVEHGVYANPIEIKVRLDQALEIRKQFSTRIVAATTTRIGIPFSDQQMDYACWSAWMFDIDGIAWGEPDFSADNLLPERACGFLKLPHSQLQARTSAVQSGPLFLRDTEAGMVVLDTNSKTVVLRPSQSGPLLNLLQGSTLARRRDVVDR